MLVATTHWWMPIFRHSPNISDVFAANAGYLAA